MRSKEMISTRQVFFILSVLLAGVYSITSTRTLVLTAGTDGIWAIPIGMVIIGIMIFVGHSLAMKYPDQTVIEYSEVLLGKFVGKLIGLVLSMYFLALAVLYLRNYTEMVVAVLLPETPRWVLLLITISVISMILNNGLEDIARLTELLTPLFILGFVLLFVGTADDMDFIRLLPMGQAEPKGIYQALSSILSFGGILGVAAMLYPYVNQPKSLKKVLFGSMLVGLLLVLVLFVSVVSIFGVQESARIMFPVIELARMLQFGEFLERAEAIFLILWLSISLVNGSFLAYCSTKGFSQVFNREKTRLFNRLILVVIFVLSILPNGMQEVSLLNLIQLRYGFYLTYSITLILWFVSMIKQKRGAKHE